MVSMRLTNVVRVASHGSEAIYNAHTTLMDAHGTNLAKKFPVFVRRSRSSKIFTVTFGEGEVGGVNKFTENQRPMP